MTYPSLSSTQFDLLIDENDVSETQFLKNSIVNHTKYGSTNHNVGPPQSYRYITHYVDSSDTLQGLALKYGCKIETIKKFNKLYSDDNNYLRSRLSLLIPIELSIESRTNANLDSDFSSAQTSNSSLESKEIHHFNNSGKLPNHSLSFDKGSATKPLKHSAPNKSTSLCDSSRLNSDNNLAEESVADFLIRIDSSIAKTRNQVEQMSKKDPNQIEQELNRTTRRFNTPKLAQSERAVLSASSSSRSLFPFDGDDNLPRVSMSNNNRKKVKSSLKRFEKSHEEILSCDFHAEHFSV